MQVLVSVIIPVYNTEKYMRQCVDSVLQQDYPAMEIILVDDGSTDSSPEICDCYHREYPERIRVLHQKNQGLGMARNAGLANALGKYVSFVDSDDMLDGTSSLTKLVKRAEQIEADIVTGSYCRFHGEETSGINHHCLREGAYTGTRDFRIKGFLLQGHLAYDWGKLYRREFLLQHNIWCKPYPFTQDKAHNMLCYLYQPVYGFIDDSVYRYRVNESSVTYRYKEEYITVWTAIAEDFWKIARKKGASHELEDMPGLHIFFGTFFLVKQELLRPQRHKLLHSRQALKRYGKQPYVKQAMTKAAKGRFTKGADIGVWKYLIPIVACGFRMHMYLLLAIGMKLLLACRIDQRITRSRYGARKEEI